MREEVFSKTTLLITACICLLLTFVYFLLNQLNRNTKTAICRSKAGVMVYVRLENRYDLLINPQDDTVFSCLGRYMPYYDRTVEGVIYLYPFKEIEFNIKSIIQRYSIKNVYSDCENGHTSLDLEDTRTIKIKHCLSNKDVLKIHNSTIQFLSSNERYINVVRVDSRYAKTSVIVYPKNPHLQVEENSNVIFLYRINRLEFLTNFIKNNSIKSVYAQTSVVFIPAIRDKVINLNKVEMISF